ncbi:MULTISPECIES: penicillin acylase family protein [unclassified Mumia]|uniref:penicillin acylase family protein n=2 Tax=Mumia TaxID=1546255 RepID=UPI0027E243D9|nr:MULTISPECIES: penicillin acylase family protein [unclassified Mumia]
MRALALRLRPVLTRRLVVVVAIVLAVALVAMAAVAVVTVRRPFPDRTGSVQIPGLSAEVEVLRDDRGIPQVYADTAEDLFLAQGYVHAQDRFFEMDFRRHVTAGRLAELFGESALETDKVVRTMGWRRVAEQELAKVSPSTRRYLEAYARGVNAYVGDREPAALGLEYSVLALTGPDYEPEPWTPVDSLAWLKAMAWDLRSNMGDEIDRVLSTEKLTRSQVDTLYPGFPFRRHDPIVTRGTVDGDAFDQSAGRRRNADTDRAEAAPDSADAVAAVDESSSVSPALDADGLKDLVGSMRGVSQVAAGLPTLLGFGEGTGSNAWAVSGERSATGQPILANDPHLAPSMPGIWHQMGLHCRVVDDDCPFDVAGFTFSGMPGVVIGHNADIAWGFTTMYADVTDLYVERIEGDRYLYDGTWRPLIRRTETFEVAGQDEPETITVRETRHGPVLSDVDETLEDVAEREGGGTEFGVSLQWTALTPGRTMDAVFGIGKASDWAGFRKAARHFAVPSQNLVYADRSGNIGYQAPGSIPIRARGDGRWPVPGWDRTYRWKGFIPYAELPSVLNPAEGYVVSANQQVIGRQYPYLIGTGQAAGYRSQRIIDLLSSTSKLDVDDMSRIQNDTYNSQANTLMPYLLEVDLGSGYYADGQDLLRDWDMKQDRDSGAAAYFASVWRNLLARTFHDDLPQDVWPAGGERWFEVVRRLLNAPDSSWWDDRTTKRERETRDDVLRTAMRDARDEMTRLQSLDPTRWTWGRVHTLTLENQTLGTSGIALVERLFNRGPYAVAGGSGLVDATAWDAAKGYEVTAVPSMRMVVDLDDLDRSRWINLTGVSGHAFHGNYVDQTSLWADGKTLAWPFSPEKVKAAADDELTLTPRLEH